MTKFPIRARLTLWYLLLMLVTFIVITIYLLTRFQISLKSTIDTSLQITVSKTINALDEEDFKETGKLTFDHVRQTQVAAATGFAMQIISAQGAVWDTYGSAQSVPQWGGVELGYSTQTGGSNNEEWRIYSEPIFDLNGQTIGWVQAAQSLNSVSMTLQELRNQLLLGIPLLLLFAGVGGYILSNRALQPIEKITNTAQEITAKDLSKRLDYQGAMDEVGRLAQTFDQMLTRLQSSFERERRFTADAAHELRTPLTVLKGYQELVDEGLVEKRRGLGMFVREGATGKLMTDERAKFLNDEWPRVAETIQRLGLNVDELLKALAKKDGGKR